MSKVVLFLVILLTSNAFAGACYTAVNGFVGVVNVAGQMATQSKNTNMKLNELNEIIKERDDKINELATIEKSIKMINQLKYEKNEAIINSLKAKNELKNNSITIEQVLNDLKN